MTKYAYDLLGRLEFTTTGIPGETPSDPSRQRVEVSRYDLADNKIFTWDAQDARTSYEYDALNRQIKIVQGVNLPIQQQVQTQNVYDGAGRTVQMKSAYVTTNYDYDRLGRLIKQYESPKHSITFTYDEVGNKTSTMDSTYGSYWEPDDQQLGFAGGKHVHVTEAPIESPIVMKTMYVYDALDRQVTVTDPYGGSTGYLYDPAGQILQHLTRIQHEIAYDVNGDSIEASKWRSFSYERLGRLNKETWNTSTYKKQEDIWNLIEAKPDRVNHFIYDAADNLVGSYRNDRTFTGYHSGYPHNITVDPLGRVTSDFTEIGGTVTFQYDAAGQKIQAVDKFGGTKDWNYDIACRLVGLQFDTTGDGQKAEFTFDYETDSSLNVGGLLDRQTHFKSYVWDDTTKIAALTTTTEFRSDGYIKLRKFDRPGLGTLDKLEYEYRDDGLLHTETRTPYYDSVYFTGTAPFRDESTKIKMSYLLTNEYDAHGQINKSTVDAVPAAVDPLNVREFNFDAYGRNPFTNVSEYTQAQTLSRINQDGQITIHDGEGNLIQAEMNSDTSSYTWTYEYDHTNYLVAATKPKADEPLYQTLYEYNGEGTLIYRTEALLHPYPTDTSDEYGNTNPPPSGYYDKVGYATIGGQIWADVDANTSAGGELRTRYFYNTGTDQILARQDAKLSMWTEFSAMSLYMTDRQGSVVGIIDAVSGQPRKVLRYFGTQAVERWTANQTTNPLHDRYEHPFYREVDGWVAVHDLRVGYRLWTEDGFWVEVEEVANTGKWWQLYWILNNLAHSKGLLSDPRWTGYRD